MHELAAWLSVAQHSLDIAIYDIRLTDGLDSVLRDALVGAASRGVSVRLAYNFEDNNHPVPVPPPADRPSLIESLPFPDRGHPRRARPDAPQVRIRDQTAVWTGSTNWTSDSWTREGT